MGERCPHNGDTERFGSSGAREWPRDGVQVVLTVQTLGREGVATNAAVGGALWNLGGKPKIVSRWRVASEWGWGGFRMPEPKVASRWRVASGWGWGGFRHPGGC